METIPNVLTIAGSDSGGGAGIQADLKSFSANRTYGASVITALTAQNTLGVTAIHDLPADFIAAQMDAVFSDIAIDAVKIGMLSKPEVIVAVANGLRRYGARNIILDPVMVTTSGDPLICDDAVDTLVSKLFPLADCITPNLHEAARLTGKNLAENEDAMLNQAENLRAMGARAVLLKGGHFREDQKEAIDLLNDAGHIHWLTEQRVATTNTHGTGCSLSSAVTANLARGMELSQAVSKAKGWLTKAIDASEQLRVGAGPGPVHHFYKLWNR